MLPYLDGSTLAASSQAKYLVFSLFRSSYPKLSVTEVWHNCQVGLDELPSAVSESRLSLVGLDICSARSSNSLLSCFPSTASLMSDIVLSMLRRLVLGLVIVVPRLACRPCPRRKAVGKEAELEVGDGDIASGGGDMTGDGVFGAIGCVIEPFVIAASIAALTPFGEGGAFPSSMGVEGLDK